MYWWTALALWNIAYWLFKWQHIWEVPQLRINNHKVSLSHSLGSISHVFILAIKAGEILRYNPFRFNHEGEMRWIWQPAWIQQDKVRRDAGVSIRERRQRETRRKRIWHIHCEDAETGYHGSQDVTRKTLAFRQGKSISFSVHIYHEDYRSL